MNKRKIGTNFESLALQYLEKAHFALVQKNFYTRFGEIDLIMKKNNILHFIEVKFSSSFNPLLNITDKKMQRIIKSADIFLQNHELDSFECIAYCFSAIGISKNNINFIENITMA